MYVVEEAVCLCTDSSEAPGDLERRFAWAEERSGPRCSRENGKVILHYCFYVLQKDIRKEKCITERC